jgi:acylpyruvate hydrolase
LDWEAELAIVIGRPQSRASRSEARAGIAGYTVLNDVSARDWQNRTSQWLQGKNFDATTPVGPALVTPDEVGHATDLKVTCLVNDEVVQDASTAELVFGPVEAVEYISEAMSLHPGDIIATGTPAGVGAGRDPRRFLSHGDVLTTRIEGLGECRNHCVRAGGSSAAGREP